MSAYLYILRCADGSCYVGTTAGSQEKRVAEHQAGTFGGYTSLRRPVELVFHSHFERLEDAAAAERQVRDGVETRRRHSFAVSLPLCHLWHAAAQPLSVVRDGVLRTPPQDDVLS